MKEMENIKKSLSALDRALNILGRDGMNEIFENVDALNIKGVTYVEYISHFEDNYHELFDILCQSPIRDTNNIENAKYVDIVKHEELIGVNVIGEHSNSWLAPPDEVMNAVKENHEPPYKNGGFLFTFVLS